MQQLKTSLILKDGANADIVGDAPAVEAIIKALEAAGYWWNDAVLSFEDGFYTEEGPPAASGPSEGGEKP